MLEQHIIMLCLPNDAISCVLMQVDCLADVRRIFRTCRQLSAFGRNHRLSLMWFEKHKGVIVAFKQALVLGDHTFARDLIPNAKDWERRTFLEHVVKHGIAELMTPLIDPAQDINMPIDRLGSRLLHIAATGPVAAVLVALPGIDVNVADSGGYTPLLRAVQHGRVDVVAVLLAAQGININAKNLRLLSVLHIAAAHDHVAIIDMLRVVPGIQVNDETRLAVRALIAFPSVNPNVRAREGMTPLHSAIKSMWWEVVEELVATQGVDVNAVDTNGMTPLHIAVIRDSVEVVKLLLAVPGIDTTIRCRVTMETPMDIAARLGRSNMFAFSMRCWCIGHEDEFAEFSVPR